MNEILVFLTLLPALTALLILALPQGFAAKSRQIALIGSTIVAALAIYVSQEFDPRSIEVYQFGFKINWLPVLGVHFELGLDGLNLPLVVMAAVLTPLIFVGTWTQTGKTVSMQRHIAAMVLLMETGAIGSFLSQDLFLFYVFWELILFPAYILIGMYGSGNRMKATMQFFLYTFAGSLLMLVAIAWLIYQQAQVTGVPSASLSDLMKLPLAFDPNMGWRGILSPQGLLFAAFAAAFFIKSPLVPFHAWLPSTYTQAPTIVSIYLAAILSKMGTYGIIKFLLPLFPDAVRSLQDVLMWLSAIGIVYGAMLAIAQKNFKTAIAYSSLSHVSYILLGLFSLRAAGISGALLQMVNHGVGIAGLFLIVGFLEKRRGTLDLKAFGGWAPQVPVLATAFMVLVLATVALPGSGGFVGEFAILVASFRVDGLVTCLAATGMVLGAVYMLNLYQSTMFGPGDEEVKKVSDLDYRELLVMLVIGFFIVGIGLTPQPFVAPSRAAVEATSKRVAPPEKAVPGSTQPGQV